MAIKLDMSKNYDRVECSYLKAVMRRMGFGEKWIKLMTVCVKLFLISFLLMVNQREWSSNPIRQGDPLSPFFFLLCSEGLHGLISQEVVLGNLKVSRFVEYSSRLTHLLFADDVSFFVELTNKSARKFLTSWKAMVIALVSKSKNSRQPSFSTNL